MFSKLFVLGFLLVIMTACASTPALTEKPTLIPTPTEVVATLVPTQTVLPKPTASPTAKTETYPTSTATVSPVTPTPFPTPTLTPVPKIISEKDFQDPGVTLKIAKIGLLTRLDIALLDNQGQLDFSTLMEYPVLVETHQIGKNGLALIVGHRQWGIYPKVFAKLDRLEKGDIVNISTGQLSLYFEVFETIIVDPSDLWPELEKLDAQLSKDTPAVVLMTCTPYGTAKQRMLVVAKIRQ